MCLCVCAVAQKVGMHYMRCVGPLHEGAAKTMVSPPLETVQIGVETLRKGRSPPVLTPRGGGGALKVDVAPDTG